MNTSSSASPQTPWSPGEIGQVGGHFIAALQTARIDVRQAMETLRRGIHLSYRFQRVLEQLAREPISYDIWQWKVDGPLAVSRSIRDTERRNIRIDECHADLTDDQFPIENEIAPKTGDRLKLITFSPSKPTSYVEYMLALGQIGYRCGTIRIMLDAAENTWLKEKRSVTVVAPGSRVLA